MYASLKHYRQSPRKVRLLADAVSGKSVREALTVLSHANQRCARPLKVLVTSAIANAQQSGTTQVNDLPVTITVDGGRTLRRTRAGSRGSPKRILRRSSNIAVIISKKV